MARMEDIEINGRVTYEPPSTSDIFEDMQRTLKKLSPQLNVDQHSNLGQLMHAMAEAMSDQFAAQYEALTASELDVRMDSNALCRRLDETDGDFIVRAREYYGVPAGGIEAAPATCPCGIYRGDCEYHK
jgi:hypothetical protein